MIFLPSISSIWAFCQILGSWWLLYLLMEICLSVERANYKKNGVCISNSNKNKDKEYQERRSSPEFKCVNLLYFELQLWILPKTFCFILDYSYPPKLWRRNCHFAFCYDRVHLKGCVGQSCAYMDEVESRVLAAVLPGVGKHPMESIEPLKNTWLVRRPY